MDKRPGVKQKSLQSRNRSLVLEILRHSGPVSIPEIAEKVGLSKPTLTKIVNFLLKSGFILAAGKGLSSGEGGKRPELFQFNPGHAFALAVHIAPESIETAISDLSGSIVDAVSHRIRPDEALAHVVELIGDSVRNLMARLNLRGGELIGIAIGAHGITDIETGVSLYSPHFPSWGTNVELKRLIGENLGLDIPILVDNQIRFQVYAERAGGVARGFDNVVVIEGGEGLVSGIVRDGRIHRGRHNLAGEIGHLPLDPHDGELCGCGARGCFELLVACRRVLALYRRELEPTESAGPAEDIDGKIGIQEVFRRAEAGEAAARRVLDGTALWFARGIATLILVEDPEIVVFQGIYAEAGDYFLGRIRHHLSEIAIPKVRKDVRIEYSSLGPGSCVIGATAFLNANYFSSIFL